MERVKTGYDWNYWGWWVLANVLGWGLSVSSVIALGVASDEGLGYLGLVLSGLLTGLAQWLVLSRRFSRSRWLIPAYALCWFVALWLGMKFGFLTPEPFLMGALGGALAGVVQWFGMRRRLPRSWIWIPTMTAASLLGCWLGVEAGVSAYNGVPVGMTLAYAIGGAVAGAVIGVLSGLVLITLIRNDARRTAGATAGATA